MSRSGTTPAVFCADSCHSLLTCETNSVGGILTVAGTTTALATNVAVTGAGLTNSPAQLYGDASWAVGGASLVTNGTLSAFATDSYGRTASTSIPIRFPLTGPCFIYDDNGNLLTDGNRYFEYDYENQLTAVTVSNSWRSEFSYDGFGRRRIRKEFTWQSGVWTNLTEVHYIYDGRLVIQEQDTNGLTTVHYTRGNDLSGTLQGAGGIGGLLARSDAQNKTVGFPQITNIAFLESYAPIPPLPPWLIRNAFIHHFYHADGNGNITALFSPRIRGRPAALTRYSYDPFGNILWMSGPMATTNLYRFSSKEFHERSGLVYYLYRYYEPNLQRWINRDPLHEMGGINLYGFVFNNPVDLNDSDGRILPAVFVGALFYFMYEAIANAPGPNDQTSAPYNDSPDPRDAYGFCTGPLGALVSGVLSGVAENLGNRHNGDDSIPAMPPPGGKPGVVYKVPGKDTPSGKPYIGRTTNPKGPPGRGKRDGRDRKDAKVVDRYNTRPQGRINEQNGIDKEGGIGNLDNKRNEIDPNKRCPP